MNDEEQRARGLSGEQRETAERIVQAGLNKMRAVKDAMPSVDTDVLIEKTKHIHLNIMNTMRPILAESAKKGIVDRKADLEMLTTLYLQQLDSNFSKDELTCLLTHFIIEQIR